MLCFLALVRRDIEPHDCGLVECKMHGITFTACISGWGCKIFQLFTVVWMGRLQCRNAAREQWGFRPINYSLIPKWQTEKTIQRQQITCKFQKLMAMVHWLVLCGLMASLWRQTIVNFQLFVKIERNVDRRASSS